MKSFLFFAALAAAQQAPPQYIQLPGVKIPYLPFLPYQSWPSKSPAPSPAAAKEPVIPKLKSTPRIIGLADDPALDRDSCGSVTFADRTFWTCRDTQLFYKNGSVQIAPLITSTASWSNLLPGGGPALQISPPGADPLKTIVLKQYGDNSLDQAFFPVLPGFCDKPAGSCADGTRFALWPDLPPMVTSSSLRSGVTAYSWIRQSHITSDLGTVTENPASLLYRVNYHPSIFSYVSDRDQLPEVTVVAQDFWKEGEISFGNYGNVVRDGTAFLYGQAEGITALAKVPVDQVENRNAYQYWVDGVWTSSMPFIGQDGINITNANAGGQGTYYYSDIWQSYVWVGGRQAVGSEMFITTAPAPEGPWIEPTMFFKGVDGNYFLGAYSIQAHPGLSRWGVNELYVTYTKNDVDAEGVNVYSSPLVYVEWE